MSHTRYNFIAVQQLPMPAGFEGFFEEIGVLSPQRQQDMPRVRTIAEKFGLEFLPPPA